MAKPICGFCTSIGHKGPHDHWMRMRVNGNYKTICPNLLQTECQKCFKKGHTARYCTMNIVLKVNYNSDRIINKNNQKTNNEIIKKETKINNIWEALCMDSDDSEDELEIPNKPYVYMNWADVDPEDNELPPLPEFWKIKST